MLRYGSPTMHFRRTSVRDLEPRGTQIREGDKVVVWFVSGNYDEEVFPQAERFDVGRDPTPHMTFGSGGPHVCLGAHLARAEGEIVFGDLLARVDHIELDRAAIGGAGLRYRPSFTLRGLEALPVRIS